jgi:hypothetical protein
MSVPIALRQDFDAPRLRGLEGDKERTAGPTASGPCGEWRSSNLIKAAGCSSRAGQ